MWLQERSRGFEVMLENGCLHLALWFALVWLLELLGMGKCWGSYNAMLFAHDPDMISMLPPGHNSKRQHLLDTLQRVCRQKAQY